MEIAVVLVDDIAPDYMEVAVVLMDDIAPDYMENRWR